MLVLLAYSYSCSQEMLSKLQLRSEYGFCLTNAGCDVLWGGCPMITLPLERMASRVAASLCYATGLGSEMVVNSQQASLPLLHAFLYAGLFAEQSTLLTNARLVNN